MKTIDQRILSVLRELRSQSGVISAEQNWMFVHTEPDLQASLKKTSILGLHMLSAILKKEQTGIELATALGASRGGVTQAAKILMAEGLMTSYQTENNRKKIFYRLTEKGRRLAKQHDKMHALSDEKYETAIFSQYSDEEKEKFASFLSALLALNPLDEK